MSEMEPRIPEWYAGKNVFLTGATGFLGKALIEKLLRSCPDIGHIYMLMRPKRGKHLSERATVLFADPLFERVKSEQPNLKLEEKLKPVAGDVKELNLGLSASDRQILVDNINIIFHVAASVRFDDSLTDAVLMNVRGTREVCQLALDAKNLQVHIHVSTAFANCDRSEAKEVLYPQKLDWRKMIEIAEKFDKNMLSILTEKFMNNMPNTYCFTKHIAEHVANDMLVGKKPCKIFRPSIVISSMRDEPVRGWIDNFNGPVGLLVAYGKGIMRTSYYRAEYKPDYVPVDVVTKALAVSAWDLAVRRSLQPEVLHCTCHELAPWLRPSANRLAQVGLYASKEMPFNNILWVPSTHNTTSKLVWYLRTLFFMLLPSFILDSLLKMLGQNSVLMKIQKKIFVAQLALRYFMINEWKYHNDNLQALQNRIHQQDKDDWDYDFADYDLEKFVVDAIKGVRKYLLKESEASLPNAKKHYQRMVYINRIIQIITMGIIIWIVFNIGVVNYGFRKISNSF